MRLIKKKSLLLPGKKNRFKLHRQLPVVHEKGDIRKEGQTAARNSCIKERERLPREKRVSAYSRKEEGQPTELPLNQMPIKKEGSSIRTGEKMKAPT